MHKARNFNLVFNPGLETTRTYLPINPTQSINAPCQWIWKWGWQENDRISNNNNNRALPNRRDGSAKPTRCGGGVKIWEEGVKQVKPKCYFFQNHPHKKLNSFLQPKSLTHPSRSNHQTPKFTPLRLPNPRQQRSHGSKLTTASVSRGSTPTSL